MSEGVLLNSCKSHVGLGATLLAFDLFSYGCFFACFYDSVTEFQTYPYKLSRTAFPLVQARLHVSSEIMCVPDDSRQWCRHVSGTC